MQCVQEGPLIQAAKARSLLGLLEVVLLLELWLLELGLLQVRLLHLLLTEVGVAGHDGVDSGLLHLRQPPLPHRTCARE